ncbi:MAG: 50S ribosomal protein L24 [Candidatus Aenigmarchaeota archaeon]|nr:50S ribosomal protein L24 [Candidatus Aenigmarchaeota archaeon]
MKQKFSKEWKSSVQPRKQRKYRYNAPLHIRHKFLSAHLASNLRERFKRRSLPLRKGDDVEVMRGSDKGLKGSVDRIDLKKAKVYIDSIKVKKVDGSEVHRPIDPSNLRIVDIKTDDKMRLKVLKRKENVSEKEMVKISKKKKEHEKKRESK